MIKPIFKLTAKTQEGSYAKFIIEPLVKGYGYTLGNALRRVLLSSLEGFAVTHVEINNVSHQFTTITGMKEDVVGLILNIKKIRVKSAIDTPAHIYLEVQGPKTVTAADLKPESGVEVVNKDLVLCHLTDKKAKLKMKLTVNKGYRYVLAEELDRPHLGVIPIDAVFSPIIKVNYKVEATRVGRETDWDKLILEVTTDGTIDPETAIKRAAEILYQHFNHLVNPQETSDDKAAEQAGQSATTGQTDQSASDVSIDELNLPLRVSNALKRADIYTLTDLAQMTLKDLQSVKNLGKKSVDLVVQAAKEAGVTIE